MISINLLPHELRPRKKSVLPIKSMAFIGAGIIAICILIHILAGIIIARDMKTLSSRKKEYELIRPEYERVQRLKSDKEKLEAKMAIMDRLLSQRLLWSKKLNQLSDLMPPRVWLSSLSVISRQVAQQIGGKDVTVERKTLLIRGKTYSSKGETMVEQQGDFMRRIKGHGPFFQNFENIEFISTERETIGQTEIMRFELICPLKEYGQD